MLCLPSVTLALLASVATTTYAEDKKEDAKKSAVDGVWVWEAQGQNNQTRTLKLTLKQEGEKLTGYLPGPNDTKVEIADGKVEGNKISFTVTRKRNGNKFVSKYLATIEGDTLKGKIESEHDGQTRSRDWEAKRETEEKKPAA